MIRLARPWIGDAELDGVREVLSSGMLVMGARVAAFEETLAARCGRAHAVACASGTSALELALEALGVDGGDVLCPDLSWPSPGHAIARRGARPVLVDVSLASWNSTPEALAKARTDETRAAIVIDQFGTPASHTAIAGALPGLPLIVDAACSLGATIEGAPSASHGAIACLSFHPRKLLTTGEGGACVTDDEALAERLRMLRNHGQLGGGRFGEPAGNHRMTEMAAAMGLAQLERLETILERRRALAQTYRGAIEGFAWQEPPPGAVSNHQTFGLLVPEGAPSGARDAVLEALRSREVEAGRLSYALHRVGSLAGDHGGGPFPNASAIEDRGFAIPLHPLMSDADGAAVVEALRAAREAAGLA